MDHHGCPRFQLLNTSHLSQNQNLGRKTVHLWIPSNSVSTSGKCFRDSLFLNYGYRFPKGNQIDLSYCVIRKRGDQ